VDLAVIALSELQPGPPQDVGGGADVVALVPVGQLLSAIEFVVVRLSTGEVGHVDREDAVAARSALDFDIQADRSRDHRKPEEVLVLSEETDPARR